MTVKDLIFVGLFPLWAIYGALVALGLGWIEKRLKIRVWGPLYAVPLFCGLLLAMLTLLLAHCGWFVGLPITNPWCQSLGF